ncbi:SDR family NAD(P)-dependent oxidoreductase [uncultured Tessaracoccus sp.]|uniref:SDR family NAD(P)-dependent oxidoreductase n=1 Tax=uncultured Tessaracoccus sp. TaxID=905023 RepID=UPI00262BF4E4|nr:glucose 1-dehydrogenase [uncultured Tessaracoccus sp.]
MNILEKFRLDGQTAIVTGSTRGIGRALAHGLAEAGASIVIVGRDEAAASQVMKEIEERGQRSIFVAADVTVREDCERIRDEAIAAFGRIDVLVNNAGICIHEDSLKVTFDDWRAVFNVNVDGVWLMSQVIGETMVSRGGGRIVNVGSMSGIIVNRPQWQPAYNASKAAVHQLTRSLAAEWAPSGVRVNAVAPGYVHTDMSPLHEPHFRVRWIDDAPMLRAAEPEEIAPAVLYLASEASSFVTGEILVTDGGYSIF